MTFQRSWRDWLTGRLIASWLADQRYQQVGFVNGRRQNAEYRITEDARLATDAPIDLVVGLLSSILMAGTFVTVLWNVGGSLEVCIWQATLIVPGYLVIASIVYSAATTFGMMAIGHNMVDVIERKNQAEADFKYVVARVNTRTTLELHIEDAAILATAQESVIGQWKRLCGQHMRTTVVSHGNSLLAPIIGLILCAPNYVMGTVTLGEVTQAAAAFMAVQGAFNWLVDNYPRLASASCWIASTGSTGAPSPPIRSLLLAEAEDIGDQVILVALAYRHIGHAAVLGSHRGAQQFRRRLGIGGERREGRQAVG